MIYLITENRSEEKLFAQGREERGKDELFANYLVNTNYK